MKVALKVRYGGLKTPCRWPYRAGICSKKLSKYGMAIKISTDGYIEMYIKGELVYAVK